MSAVALKSLATEACPLDFIPEQGGVCALVEGRQVALFKVDGAVYALDNYDPFSEAFVLSRGIVGDLQGQLVIASPIYKQHFNLETGACLEDDSVVLQTWQTEVVDGTVYVKHHEQV